jgi:secreted PhoX family phosphatase
MRWHDAAENRSERTGQLGATAADRKRESKEPPDTGRLFFSATWRGTAGDKCGFRRQDGMGQIQR